jgi:hypothetical protein
MPLENLFICGFPWSFVEHSNPIAFLCAFIADHGCVPNERNPLALVPSLRCTAKFDLCKKLFNRVLFSALLLLAAYLRINASTLAAGFGTYFDMLLRTNFPWQSWCIGMLVLLLLFVLLRSRVAIFFQLYIFITFLPVIFLVNHRFPFYWYLPFLGVCGLAAVLAKNVVGLIRTRNPQWIAKSGAYSVFVLLCWGDFLDA